MTASIISFPDGTVSQLMFVNATGAGQARSLHFLAVTHDRTVQGVAGHGFLSPSQSVRFNLPLDVQERRTPLVWACLDTNGTIHAGNNDGDARRYSRRKVRKGRAPRDLDAIFETLYPDVPIPALSLPAGPRSPISMQE